MTAMTVSSVVVTVLNASYEPLQPTKMKRALALVLRGDAVVDTADPNRVLHYAGKVMEWPLVIRLIKYLNIPMRTGPAMWSKAGVLKRDGHRCGYCDMKADTVDHILPQARGGKNTWENTVAACQPCNAKKADHLLEDIGMTLLITPTVPQRAYISAGKSHKKKVKSRHDGK